MNPEEFISLRDYTIENHRKGVEADHARIGIQVALNWLWPLAHDQEDWEKMNAMPGFDPDTRLYCYLGDEMIGCMFWQANSPTEGAPATATVDFPRMLPGHEYAAELMLAHAFETIRKKGISRVVGRVNTMAPGDILLAEKMGYSITDWGHKVYYTYEMAQRAIDIPADIAEEIDPEKDLQVCAELATHWYGRSSEWCLSRIQEMMAWGAIRPELELIAHLGVRKQETLVAACLTGPNPLRPSTAANYYIYAPDEDSLKPLLVRAVGKCIDHGGIQTLIADLVNEHRSYEHVYQELGFQKAIEWARCEKILR